VADRTYDGYFGPTTFAETIDTFYSMDLMVHAWDIARAAGRPDLEPIAADDLTRAARLLEPVGDTVRSPGIFGPPVEPSVDATDQDRFLAWTGRHP
ncbi:MAG: TIGR03086 family protein, partial [Ilumatobacteraceae bacterium]